MIEKRKPFNLAEHREGMRYELWDGTRAELIHRDPPVFMMTSQHGRSVALADQVLIFQSLPSREEVMREALERVVRELNGWHSHNTQEAAALFAAQTALDRIKELDK